MATNNVLNLNVATQAIQETGTSTTDYVAPGVQQYHTSAAKAFLAANSTGSLGLSYNITSITDDGVGLITVTIATDFSGADYTITGLAKLAGNVVRVGITSQAAGSFAARGNNASDTLTDPDLWYFTCFGDL